MFIEFVPVLFRISLAETAIKQNEKKTINKFEQSIKNKMVLLLCDFSLRLLFNTKMCFNLMK